MANSAIYEKVTYKQIDDMKHALGFATKSRVNWYHVSEDGRIFLERVTGVKFLPESD